MEVQRQVELMVVMEIIIIIKYLLRRILITTQRTHIITQAQLCHFLQKHNNHHQSSHIPRVGYRLSSKQPQQFFQDSVLIMFLKQIMSLPTMET
jgi:hypothetical protein